MRFAASQAGPRDERLGPADWAAPIVRTALSPQVFGLAQPGNGLVHIDAGAFFNLLARQRHIQTSAFPVRIDHGAWRDRNLAATKPAAGLDREIAEGPGVVVEKEPLYGSKLAVRSPDAADRPPNPQKCQS